MLILQYLGETCKAMNFGNKTTTEQKGMKLQGHPEQFHCQNGAKNRVQTTKLQLGFPNSESKSKPKGLNQHRAITEPQ